MIKFISLLFFSLIFLACASVPQQTETSQPPVTSEVKETNDTESAAETQTEEIPEPQEEESPAEDNIILEPVEDIAGYYESDSESVFPPFSSEEPIEEPENIPVLTEEQKTDDASQNPPEEEVMEFIEAELLPYEKPEEEIQKPVETEPENLPAEEQNNIETEQPAPEQSEAEIIQPQVPQESVAQEQESQESVVQEQNNEEQIPSPEISAAATEDIPAEETADTADTEAIETAPIVPSRAVTIKNSQYLDIVYPGKGWIYLGEQNGMELMRYFGRRIGEKDTSFSLRSRQEGSTILHFYKNDNLTGNFIDDYLAVEIKGKNTTQERVTAPDYAETVPPKPEKPVIKDTVDTVNKAVDQATDVQTEKQTAENTAEEEQVSEEYTDETQAASEQLSAPAVNESDSGIYSSDFISEQTVGNTEKENNDDLLTDAQKKFDSKDYAAALSALDTFLEKSASRIDEALFLQAQIFESNSSERNIKNALDNYETIVRRYPQSINWKKARERATYLRKFYFDIQ